MVDSSTLGLEAERGTSGVEADTRNRLAGADIHTPAAVVDSRPQGAEQPDTAWARGTYTLAAVWECSSKTFCVPIDENMGKSE